MYEDHLRTCEYCQKAGRTRSAGQIHHKPTIRIKSASSYAKDKKPTIFVKSASTYRKQRKMTELAAIIRGTSYPPISIPARTKGASEVARKPGPIEREAKLRALGKMVRG